MARWRSRPGVLLLRDLVLRRQRLVSRDVVLRFEVVGLGLAQRRLSGLELPFGGGEARGRVVDVGLRGRELARGIGRRDRDAGRQRRGARLVVGQRALATATATS